MYLWKKDKLYPNELNSYLEPIDAGFISIVMGQCYSGGFIEPLKKTNRIIATACDANERSYGSTTIPFDEFLYHWTSAVNGYDAYGKKLKVKGNLPIVDAQAYAAKNDVYANDKAEYGHEVPQINYFTHSVVYDLSLANIPPVVDLCFEKYRTPVTSTLKTKSYNKDKLFPIFGNNIFGRFGYYSGEDTFEFSQYRFWENPYIWVRNEEDGTEFKNSEKISIDEDCSKKDIYLYTQVRNKGVKPYTTKNMSVKAYWTVSSVCITAEAWKGQTTSETEDGGVFGSESIKEELQPGDAVVVEMAQTFRGDFLKALKENDGNACYLAYIKESNSPNAFPVEENDIAEVWATDKLGQTNILYQELSFYAAKNTSDSLFVKLANPGSVIKNWAITAKILNYMDSLRTSADVSLKLSPNLVTSWNNSDQQCINIKEIDRINGTFQMDGDSASLGAVKLQPYQRGKIGIKCNFFAENGITEKKTFDVIVAVKDDATGKILGGETFRITQHPRPAINPQIESLRKNGMTTLTATNVSENVIYKWYDAQGTLVGEGETFAVPAGVSASAYKVKAEALSDGAISYSASVQAESSSINSVQSTTGAVNVILEGPANDGTTLRLASATGNVPVAEYSVEAGSTVCNIPAGNLPSGVYQVTMVENGVVTGIKKFTK